MLRHFGGQRQVFWSRDLPGLHCDVFFDKLSFCHDIVFAGRLDDETVTIRPSDLLLEKLQIVQINEKDLKDLAVLLREHPLGDDEADAIGAAYVAGRVSGDWGFWYTLTTNLDKLATYVGAFAAFPEADRQIVIQRIVQLRQVIDDSPKTTSWKMRAKIGTRKKWYRDVEEVSL